MTGSAAIVCGNDLAKLRSSHLVFAYFEECPDNGPNHVPKEPVGGNDEVGFGLVLLYPSGFAYVADHGLDVRVGAAERTEVLSSDQPLRGFIHGLEIEPFRYACMVDIDERIFACRDTVVIRPCRCIKTRVGLIGYTIEVNDGDRVGKQTVETVL